MATKKKAQSIAQARKDVNVDAYVSNGGLKTIYPHPKQIFDPFLERLDKDFGSTVDRVTVDTMHPVATREEGGEEHRAYGRMKVEALIGDEDVFGHRLTVGKIYVFDHKNAHYIVYGGRRSMVCLNLHILKADNLWNVSATDGSFGQDATNKILDTLFEDNEEWIEHATQLHGITLNQEATERAIGELTFRGVSAINTDGGYGFGAELVSNAAKLISEGSSRYSFDADGNTTGWNLMGALTQGITDRTYMNQAPQKTLTVVNAVKGTLGLN